MTVLDFLNENGLVRTLRQMGETRMAREVERAEMYKDSVVKPFTPEHRAPNVQKALKAANKVEDDAYWFVQSRWREELK